MSKIQDKNIQINSGIYEKGSINFEDIIFSIKSHPKINEVGSILTFTGIVRETSESGKKVKRIEIDAYDELGKKLIDKICAELKQEKGIIETKIIHLKGNFNLSDDLVYVVVASVHRKEGFDVLRKAVERYKNELTVWKKELFIEGDSEWIH